MTDTARRHYRGPAWVAKAVKLHLAGKTNVEIGEVVGVTDSAVSSQLLKNADRIPARDWLSPLALELEFDGAICAPSFARWAKDGLVRSTQSRSRMLLHKPSVVEYILKMLGRPCEGCGSPLNTIPSKDTLCADCRRKLGRVVSPYQERWEKLGKLLRDAS